MKNKQIETILALILISMFLNLIINILPITITFQPIYNQILLWTVVYICIEKMLGFKKKYRAAAIVGEIFFAIICVLLYYSKIVIDYAAYLVCSYVVISNIVVNKSEQEALEETSGKS